MADQENCKDVKLLKRTRISVFVDEALPDILVVTYEFGVQIFKGVLLESTKRNLPCGVPNLNPALNIPSKNPDDDALYAVNQRFAYTDPASAAAAKKKNVQITSKLKNNKMTVRLRPRQVLCSKCKGICNENSENVSKKRKDPDSTSAPPSQSPAKRPPASRASYLSLSNKRRAQTHEPTLVPKLTRLTLQECKDFNVDNSLLKKPLASINNHENHSSDCSSSSEEVTDSRSARKKMLRKKRSISEETSEENKDVDTILHCSSTNTRTIKISYGPQGEGTVLKIPAKLELDDSEENVEEPDANKDTTTPHDKAARKALKKAKKEAKRKVLLSSTTPSVYPGSNSPGYTIGVSSPRYTVGSASPRHGLGSNSPRYANFEINMPKKRKHKMKHKRKHRDEKDKKYKESEVSPFLSLNLKEPRED
ncbi:unnamed protein product [Brassicogethes aeneus]|uniref:PWWP domain-containing protein 2A n=1 Tax=Brassicogethes aeneus TaxID=1431903 RepID=A0A9P0B1S2_BRAAE|nr:unnamed protein product [Brassicogethes aeneus]